ncbi:hypothetical protein ABEF95_003439 [Exophiala dermatitidis]
MANAVRNPWDPLSPRRTTQRANISRSARSAISASVQAPIPGLRVVIPSPPPIQPVRERTSPIVQSTASARSAEIIRNIVTRPPMASKTVLERRETVMPLKVNQEEMANNQEEMAIDPEKVAEKIAVLTQTLPISVDIADKPGSSNVDHTLRPDDLAVSRRQPESTYRKIIYGIISLTLLFLLTLLIDYFSGDAGRGRTLALMPHADAVRFNLTSAAALLDGHATLQPLTAGLENLVNTTAAVQRLSHSLSMKYDMILDLDVPDARRSRRCSNLELGIVRVGAELEMARNQREALSRAIRASTANTYGRERMVRARQERIALANATSRVIFNFELARAVKSYLMDSASRTESDDSDQEEMVVHLGAACAIMNDTGFDDAESQDYEILESACRTSLKILGIRSTTDGFVGQSGAVISPGKGHRCSNNDINGVKLALLRGKDAIMGRRRA